MFNLEDGVRGELGAVVADHHRRVVQTALPAGRYAASYLSTLKTRLVDILRRAGQWPMLSDRARYAVGDPENVGGPSIMDRGWPARPSRARRRPSENVPEAGDSLTIHPDCLAEPEDYRQIYELRLVLEAGAAEVAARNATPGDLDSTRRCIDAMANVTELHGAYVETDISFHRAVAATIRNAFVSLFINFVDVKLKESILLALKHLDFQSTKAISVREHEDIFNAIRMRDAAAAAAAMRKHLQNSSRRLGLIPKL